MRPGRLYRLGRKPPDWHLCLSGQGGAPQRPLELRLAAVRTVTRLLHNTLVRASRVLAGQSFSSWLQHICIVWPPTGTASAPASRGSFARATPRLHRGAGAPLERRRAARGGGARRTRGAARVGALRGPPLAGPRPAHPRPAADQGARRQGDVPPVAPRLEGDAEEAREAAPARDRRQRQPWTPHKLAGAVRPSTNEWEQREVVAPMPTARRSAISLWLPSCAPHR